MLLWKNWLLQRKKVVRTVVIVLLPILFCIILVLSRNNVEHNLVREHRYPPFLVETDLRAVLKNPPEKLIFGYAPNTTLVTRIVNRAAALMNVAISTGTPYFYILCSCYYSNSSSSAALTTIITLLFVYSNDKPYNDCINNRSTLRVMGRGGPSVESTPFVRRVVGSNPALAAT